MRARVVTVCVLLAGAACSSLDEPANDPPPLDTGDASNGSDAPVQDASNPNADAADGSTPVSCPTKGGAMVRATAGFCIDAKEVSLDAYLAFIQTNPSVAAQTTDCAWNTTFAPAPSIPQADRAASVVGVDWCDAVAFCAYAGKRLCGRVGPAGTSRQLPSIAEAQNSTRAEYTSACTDNGRQRYPYGPTYMPGVCNTNGSTGQLEAPGSHGGCTGSTPGVFDLVGNAWEWIDGCEKKDGGPAADLCFFQGAGFNAPSIDIACTNMSGSDRKYFAKDVGFRCCSS